MLQTVFNTRSYSYSYPPPLCSAVNATVDPAKVPWFWMVLDRRGGLSFTYVPTEIIAPRKLANIWYIH
jgi:hypothetical protein